LVPKGPIRKDAQTTSSAEGVLSFFQVVNDFFLMKFEILTLFIIIFYVVKLNFPPFLSKFFFSTPDKILKKPWIYEPKKYPSLSEPIKN
jgi:hypothetical protein